MEERKHNSHNAFVAHFNIDSTQNKFEELKLLNDSLKAQILILSENKIDRSYPDDQFRLQGYNMYIRDRCKGGGGVIAYFPTFIPLKRMKLPKTYKTQEAIAVEFTIGRKEILCLALYRPPKQSKGNNGRKIEILAECRGRSERPFPVVMSSEAGYSYIRRYEHGQA